jgi:hypothetical protein
MSFVISYVALACNYSGKACFLPCENGLRRRIEHVYCNVEVDFELDLGRRLLTVCSNEKNAAGVTAGGGTSYQLPSKFFNGFFTARKSSQLEFKDESSGQQRPMVPRSIVERFLGCLMSLRDTTTDLICGLEIFTYQPSPDCNLFVSVAMPTWKPCTAYGLCSRWFSLLSTKHQYPHISRRHFNIVPIGLDLPRFPQRLFGQPHQNFHQLEHVAGRVWFR